MFKKFCYGYYDAPGPVGDASGSDKTGKNGNLPADVDERKVLDSFDGKDDDKTDKSDKDKADKTDKSESTSDDDEEEIENLDEDGEEEGKDGKEEDDEEEDDSLEIDDKDADESLYQKLKAKDKGIFKEIPELKHVLFREQEFTKLYPTVDDAKNAAELASTFIQFQEDIQAGDAKTLIEATKELGEDTLREFSGNFLPALLELDKDTYYETVAPEFKRMLRAALKSGDENIVQSAKNINWFLWQTLDVEKDEGFTPKSAKKDPREDKVTQREKAFEQRQFETFSTDVKSVAMRKVERIITKSLDGFELSDLTKNHLTHEIIKRTISAMDKDVRYSGQMKVLWEKAKKSGYVTDGKESIINAFLSRAKVSIPKLRQQVLAEAKVSAKQVSDNKDNKKPTRLTGNSSTGKGGQIPGKIDPKKVDWNATSERDLLDGKAPVMRK